MLSPFAARFGANERRQRRRDRARVSQRAFRARQATTLRDLKEENARLKRLIKDVVEIPESDDPTALRFAIRKAAEAAGLAPEVSHPSSASSGLGSLAHSDSTTSAPAEVSTEPSRGLIPSGVVQQQTLPTRYADSAGPHDLGPRQSSCMNFSLNCGLLAYPISPGRIVDPPLDIAPYLGPNKHTLAAQIYWYCTETSVNLLYRLAGQQPSKIAAVAHHHPVLGAMLRRVATFCSHNYILALAEARLEFYRVGYCKADNFAATRDSGLLLRQRVEQEYDVADEDLEEWSTTTAVARVVEERLQGPELRRFEAAIRNDGTDIVARNLLEAFIHKFWLESTCFGDGPRWKASYISERVEWLAQALSCNSLITAGLA